MKLALCYIPAEVWVDVFSHPWKSRKELGKIVHRFKNRRFVEILQYCLHDRGKRTLRSLELEEGKIIPLECLELEEGKIIPPRTPMPENIKFFKQIIISYFDSLALNFLRRISPLFTGVNLWFHSGDEDDLAVHRAILAHLAPLIHGIHSLTFYQSAIPLVEQYFAQQLAQITMIWIKSFDSATIQPAITFALNWLTSGERDPAEPRLFRFHCSGPDPNHLQQFLTAIQQQFHSAKTPCTFAILLFHGRNDNNIVEFHLDNDVTGEQLHGEFNNAPRFQYFRINRHQPNAGAALRKWANETTRKQFIVRSSSIEFVGDAAIGQIDANADENEDDEAGQEEDQPSTSKKHKTW